MIIIEYITWYFFEIPLNIVKIIRNYFLFCLNFFSIPLLLKTFFSPWRRTTWRSQSRGIDIPAMAEAFFSNLISRGIGAVMRFILIFFGIISEIFIITAGAAVLLLWIALPFICLWGIYYSLSNYLI